MNFTKILISLLILIELSQQKKAKARKENFQERKIKEFLNKWSIFEKYQSEIGFFILMLVSVYYF